MSEPIDPVWKRGGEPIDPAKWRLVQRQDNGLEIWVQKPARSRKPSLATALKQADRLGRPVASATIGRDGVTLTFGEPEPTNNSDAWDKALGLKQ